MKKIVLITGATSGFGRACALLFAKNGFKVIITGRRKERLDELVNRIATELNEEAYALNFDIRAREDVFDAIDSLPEAWKAVDILINNAGLAAGRDYSDEASLDDWELMIDTNLRGLMYITKAVLPVMVNRTKGHIINIGSTAGKEVYEKGNMYCATKHAVDAFSKALRIDLLRHRIKVTAIHPGAADTEFSNVRFKGDDEQARKVYEGYQPLLAEDVANLVWQAVNLPEHVCINEMVVTCLAQANSFYTYKG